MNGPSALVAIAAGAALALLAGCGGANKPRPLPAPPAFAVGITENNPHLLAPGPQPAPFAAWRDRLAALHPFYVRVLVDWSKLQPDPGLPPDWTAQQDGCMRGIPPCAPYGGLLATLRAVGAMGAEPVLVIYGTPGWAAEPPVGCERPGTTPYARLPRIAAYRAFVRALLAVGRADGIALPYWSAWNEPNLPAFLNPQRATCDAGQPTLAADAYAGLVRALEAELGAADGQDRVILGDAAGVPGPTPHATGAAELARALPDDLVCGAAAWGQHAHLVRPRGAGRQLEGVSPARTADVVGGVEDALDEHGCTRPVPVWITETGIGAEPTGCQTMAAQLRTWQSDPRVKAAFQYTFREDPAFPVGLADPGLTTLYPAYTAWLTRGHTACANSAGL